MKPRTIIKNTLNRVLGLFGAQVIGQWELEERQAELEKSQSELKSLRQKLARFLPVEGPSFSPGMLPPGAEDYLKPDNPFLAELRSRYRGLNSPAVCHSLWTDAHRSLIDLRYFRGDNSFMWQYQDQNAEVNYFLTASYLKSIDTLNLFRCLHEDGLFGAYTFAFDDNLLVSRDLLDSVSEITFLEENMGISRIRNLKVLDIGAGYGRFAHRLIVSLPLVERVICTDAVAESTFLCEYYLRFRGVTEKAKVVPLDEIEKVLDQSEIHLAVNIHSFSETTLASICWWLDLLSEHRVQYLFVVPNADEHGGTRLLTREPPRIERQDFMPAILSRGYRLAKKRAKYSASSVQKCAVSPTYYYLFEFKA
jgi:hypothetical protein